MNGQPPPPPPSISLILASPPRAVDVDVAPVALIKDAEGMLLCICSLTFSSVAKLNVSSKLKFCKSIFSN